ncbi:MAG TPA: cytochrome c peroxidase, partial [Saprospiraceae bacterium]|nr:cytochrome c peroxidase [Saprospiraceae bacterium]
MRNLLLFGLLMSGLVACNKDTPVVPGTTKGDLEDIAYNPTPYTIKKPDHFPAVPIPADNPQTAQGVQLGRRLFYDPILSGDSTQSCSSCHLPNGSFTDNLAVSKGIDGIGGKRSAMSLLNIAYVNNQPSQP